MGQVTKTNFGLVKTLRLSNAQILDASTGWNYEIVPAKSGFCPFPLFGFLHNHSVSPYGSIDAASRLYFQAGGSLTLGVLDEAVAGAKVSSILGFAQSLSAFCPMDSLISGGGVFGMSSFTDGQIGLDSNVTVVAENGGLDFSGGDPANFMELTIFYTMIPFSSI